jgi:hypothetical protein
MSSVTKPTNSLFKYVKIGWVFFPLTVILLNKGTVTPKVMFQVSEMDFLSPGS